jgi:DNA polymerase III delta prime subunit
MLCILCTCCCRFARDAGRSEPLVLALTGQTGVGKTETAWVLAEALLTKRTNYAGGTHLIPKGLVVFRGEVDRLAD